MPKKHHKKTAEEFQEWLKQNPNALHQEIFDKFNKLEDKNYKQALFEKRNKRNSKVQ